MKTPCDGPSQAHEEGSIPFARSIALNIWQIRPIPPLAMNSPTLTPPFDDLPIEVDTRLVQALENFFQRNNKGQTTVSDNNKGQTTVSDARIGARAA